MVVIGGMKCGTSATSRYLGLHPDVSMATTKEVNFFFGDDFDAATRTGHWRTGHWHRGADWYASHFDARAPIRGEASPGYTSPDHPHVAARMRALLPRARLVYLVREPAARALSHFAHHAREGAERRPVEEAVLDPHSQYLARSRYLERLAPFLAEFPAEQVLVVVSERLLGNRRAELARVFRHVGADPERWDDRLDERVHVGTAPPTPGWLREAVTARVRDATAALRSFLDDPLPEWL
jgi:hypothetical protein